MTKNNNRGIYIQSVEASKIYNHEFRGARLKNEYLGMLPYSLMSIKLQNLKGFKVKENESKTKYITDDIINVSFNYNAEANADNTIEYLSSIYNRNLSKLDELKTDKAKNNALNKLESLQEYIDKIKADKDKDVWKVKTKNELRKLLYEEGFTITNDKGKPIKYLQFQRSSSKSRKAECLFIKETLYNEMIKWSRMQLTFIKDEKVDLISLRAYESLVGSSIINTLQINPENILVIKDVKSTFKQDVKLIQATKEKGKDKLTLNNKENYDITNDIFDGESLLDNSVFAEHGVADKGFALLRQHFFKSAAFNTNIQDFLKDNTPDGIEYDDWEITNMFGEPMFAKNVDMICTPNSLKFMKFAYKMNKNTDFENQKAMWGFWKAIVGSENNVFGVCKHESASHAGVDENGFMIQRMSYQMLNASGASYGDIKQLSQFELNYIEKLKNDVMTFIQHLEMTKSEQNVNQLYIDLYNRNQNIVYTKFFKDFRSSIVNRYINKLKRGNIRVRADNLVLCSNPVEMLYAAISKLTKIEPITLSCSQVYTTQFEFSEEIVLHRNPTTSPSNMLLAKNTYNEKIKKYINVTKNILVVNSIKHDIMTRLSGCDYDSDFVHASNDETLIKLAAYAKENYTLCVDDVEEDGKTTYSLNDDDMALADNNIGVSGKLIGEIVNLGQLCMSVHYHLVNNNKYDDAKDVMHLVDLVTCISTLVIDMAKKSFVVNVKGEIASIRGKIKKYVRTNNKTTTWICKEKDHTVKPLFFEIVESKKDEVVYEQYKCPMDFLQSILKEESKRATETKTIELTDLLNTYDKDKANRNQLDELIRIGNELNTYFKKIHTKSLPKEKKTNAIHDFMRKMKTKIIKLKMKEETVYALLLNIFDEKSRVKLDTKHTRLLKLIAETHTDTFVNVFCENFNGSSIENSLKTA